VLVVIGLVVAGLVTMAVAWRAYQAATKPAITVRYDAPPTQAQGEAEAEAEAEEAGAASKLSDCYKEAVQILVVLRQRGGDAAGLARTPHREAFIKQMESFRSRLVVLETEVESISPGPDAKFSNMTLKLVAAISLMEDACSDFAYVATYPWEHGIGVELVRQAEIQLNDVAALWRSL
jgi:hypothetical protein